MKFFNLSLLAGVSLSLLVSCNTKRNPYFGDDDAQFYVNSIESDTEDVDVSSDGISNKTKINFKACMGNLAGGGLPKGLSFEILAGSEKRIASTNKDGCIEWMEEHSFDPNVKELNLRLRRTFVSKNDYNGKREVIIYWNPSSNKFQDNLKTSVIPSEVEDPTHDSFSIADASDTLQEVERIKLETQQNANGGSTQSTSAKEVESQ